MRKSLGLLEIKGLASAILVADAMAKTASVTIVGIETCKGGGWQTIKVVGDVAAVQASLSSGCELAKRHNAFVAMKTLSRPDQTIMDTWGTPVKKAELKKPKTMPPKVEHAVEPTDVQKTESIESAFEKEPVSENEPVSEYDIVVEEVIAENQPPASVEATCNLCGDPLCERVKGEPHTKCIHNTKVK
ncbi:BMC domain-containing protein [Vibrio ziniensis]|uniref:BMC domain-containing protein n=1 Tax=Vibrio ziniensis TaxID=2711221 RepID=UPI001A9A0EDB|nr:BMC domain-containing protein [Vibrio ziniensis]